MHSLHFLHLSYGPGNISEELLWSLQSKRGGAVKTLSAVL